MKTISINKLRDLFVNMSCDWRNLHLEDRTYPTYRKCDVKDLLRDFKVKTWISEHHDCDDQADDMRYYLRKNGVKVGYLKVERHMMLIFCDSNNKLRAIDPGTKRISEVPETVKYVMWW